MEQVPIATLERLLDKLLQDGILNVSGKDSILQGNSCRGNKARSLIDAVITKGSKASMMMIAHIQNCDLKLYSELGGLSVPPAPPGENFILLFPKPILYFQTQILNFIK